MEKHGITMVNGQKNKVLPKYIPPKKYGITMVDATKTWYYQNN